MIRGRECKRKTHRPLAYDCSIPTLFVRKSNKKGCGLFGHTPRINVSIPVGPKKDKNWDDVPLLSDSYCSVVDELAPIQSTAKIELEVFEEFIQQQPTLASVL